MSSRGSWCRRGSTFVFEHDDPPILTLRYRRLSCGDLFQLSDGLVALPRIVFMIRGPCFQLLDVGIPSTG